MSSARTTAGRADLSRVCLLVFLSVLASAWSGCLDDSSEATPPTDSPSTTGVPTTSDSPIPPDASNGRPTSITWNECRGMGWSIDWPNAVSLEGGETPPGWEAAPTDLDTYSVILNECQRVSIGAFERGPVRFLIESRWGFNPPESCSEFSPDYRRMKVLVSMWVDDPELVDYLRDAYGLPMRLGEFNLEVTEQGGDEMQEWTWKNGTNPDSQAVGFHVGPTTPLPYIERLVWHNGTAVSFLDLTDDYALPLVPVPTAEGTMATPMRYADRGMSAFVGGASIWKQADFFGPFYRFGDLECKQPLD